MHKLRFSTIFLVLLFLAGCVPTRSIPAETPTALSPTGPIPTEAPPRVDPTLAPVPTSTPVSPPTSAPDPTPPPDQSQVDLDRPALELDAQSAVLIDALTGDVLYEKDASRQMYPASTTKILTALLALEHFSQDEIIMVGEEGNLTWTEERIDAQKAGLNYGQELTMKELLYGLMLHSGSDAALTIAVNVARRESGEYSLSAEEELAYFSTLMNARAAAIGATATNFTNPDGIHDPNHYSTAYDLALIAQAAMQNPQFREIVATPIYNTGEFVTPSGGVYTRSWSNTNRLIQPQDPHHYPPANGIKTGTTPEAGHCLASSAEIDGRLLIAVVLNSTEEGVWSDSVALLEYARDDREESE